MEEIEIRLAGITKRIEKVRQSTGMSKNAFSQTIGMARQTYQTHVRPVKKGSAPPAAPTCCLLINVCEVIDVSAEWLLFGRGEMFNEKKVSK